MSLTKQLEKVLAFLTDVDYYTDEEGSYPFSTAREVQIIKEAIKELDWISMDNPPKVGEDVIVANSFGWAAATYLGNGEWENAPEYMTITHYKYIRDLPNEQGNCVKMQR